MYINKKENNLVKNIIENNKNKKQKERFAQFTIIGPLLLLACVKRGFLIFEFREKGNRAESNMTFDFSRKTLVNARQKRAGLGSSSFVKKKLIIFMNRDSVRFV